MRSRRDPERLLNEARRAARGSRLSPTSLLPSADLADFPACAVRPPLCPSSGPTMARGGSAATLVPLRSDGRAWHLLSRGGAGGLFLRSSATDPLVQEPEVAARRLSRLNTPSPLLGAPLADCTSGLARAWRHRGDPLDAGIHHRTRRWAAALAEAGFAGIRYPAAARPRPASRRDRHLVGPAGRAPLAGSARGAQRNRSAAGGGGAILAARAAVAVESQPIRQSRDAGGLGEGAAAA